MAILMGVLNMMLGGYNNTKIKAVCKVLGRLTLLFSFYDMKFAYGRSGDDAFIIRD